MFPPAGAAAGVELTVLSLLIRAALILGAAWLLVLAARRGSAAVRHGIWSTALFAVLALPLLAATLPPLPVRLPEPLAAPVRPPPQAARTVPASTTGSPDHVGTPAAYPGTRATSASLPSAEAGWRIELATGLLALWVLGVLGRAGWLASQIARVRRLVREADAVTDERLLEAVGIAEVLRVRRRVRLLESARVTTPLTCGLWHPVVLLPRESAAWSAERLRVVLLHEIAHIRRWDYFACLVAELSCALYWPLPLAWVARRGILSEQEQASDDLVLVSGTPAVDYADHLLAIARGLRGEAPAFSATIGMAREVGLKRRIRTILDERTPRAPLRSRLGSTSLAALCAVVLPVAAARPTPAEPAVPAAPAAPAAMTRSGVAGEMPPPAASTTSQATESSTPTYLWLEAEHGLLRGGVEAREELEASAGVFVVAGSGARWGEAALSLHLPRPGEYQLWARVAGVDAGSEISVTVDDSPGTSALLTPAEAAGADRWTWLRAGGEEAAPLTLAAGVHSLELGGLREGDRVDRLLVTSDSDFRPSGRGPGGGEVAAEQRWMEVSPGVLDRTAEYEFEVSGEGPYVLWGRVLGLHEEANSFFLSVDGGPEVIWDAPGLDLREERGRWVWDPASARDLDGRPVDPLIFDLAPGRHTVRLRPREYGTSLGGLLVTNDLSFRPRGAPTGAPLVRVWIEPETAAPVDAFRMRRGSGALGAGYLEAIGGGADRSPGEAGDPASLRFVLPHSGVYTLWARTQARTDGEDSFLVRINEGDWVRWNGIPRSRGWRWSSIHEGDNGIDPLQIALPAGENRIEIARREGGARLDRILVTNDDFFLPRGTGAE